jgi:hypothetical protein
LNTAHPFLNLPTPKGMGLRGDHFGQECGLQMFAVLCLIRPEPCNRSFYQTIRAVS